ncbi:MAG: ion channel [Candidatus Competibacter sp.]
MVTASGTLGYHSHRPAPQATWIDSFYMTFITIATIGYGETVDLSNHPMGRLFTVFIAIVGIGTLSYLFSTLVALLIDSDLNVELRKRTHGQENLRTHWPLHRLRHRARGLQRGPAKWSKTRRQFVVIENDRAALDSWLEHHPDTLVPARGRGRRRCAAPGRAVRTAAGVFAVTGRRQPQPDDCAVGQAAQSQGTRGRAAARHPQHPDKARRAGADEIVSPDFTGGMRIASAMVRPHVVNFMDQMLHSDDGLRVEEITVPAGFVSADLAATIPRSKDYLLMATHAHGKWVFNPPDDHPIHAGAALVFMGSPQGRSQLERIFKI